MNFAATKGLGRSRGDDCHDAGSPAAVLDRDFQLALNR
jgi:hypothetical protein